MVHPVVVGLLGLAALLAGCGGVPVAHIPVSGVNGPNGGADETIYYDDSGRPHFQS